MKHKWMRNEKKLSKNQKRVMDFIKQEQKELCSFPALWEISLELNIPESVLRYILQALYVRYNLITRKEVYVNVLKNKHNIRYEYDYLESLNQEENSNDF